MGPINEGVVNWTPSRIKLRTSAASGSESLLNQSENLGETNVLDACPVTGSLLAISKTEFMRADNQSRVRFGLAESGMGSGKSPSFGNSPLSTYLE